MTQYSDFAYVYDRLMCDDIDYDKWCDYIENIFGEHGVSPDTLCELACGSGNITERMLSRGYDITGTDISESMLEQAAAKVGFERLKCMDMAHIEGLGSYDSFLCMIDGLNYVITPKGVINTFKSVKKSLKPGGVFVFDISSQYKLANVLGNETFIHSEYDIFYSWQNRYIAKYNLSDMLLNFFVRNGGVYERFEERHLQRGWSREEMEIMLKKAGFFDITVYNELTFDEPCEESERLVFVCK